MNDYLAYTQSGAKFHTVERCPALTAWDVVEVVEVDSFDEIPDDREHCGHCDRMEEVGRV